MRWLYQDDQMVNLDLVEYAYAEAGGVTFYLASGKTVFFQNGTLDELREAVDVLSR